MPRFAAGEGVRAGGGGGGGSGVPYLTDLPECLIRAMGGKCYRCIFVHNISDAKQVHIFALYPPSGSVPSQEYSNMTSLVIAKLFHGFNFQWNDLFPFVPTCNKAVKQALLMQLLLSGDVANLVHDLQLRMMEFISSENDRRRRPVVIVCGSTANKAFELFIQPMPSSVLRISTFSILQFENYTAMLHLPHPSAHLMDGCRPNSVEFFQDAFSIAWILNEDPQANCDTTRFFLVCRRRHSTDTKKMEKQLKHSSYLDALIHGTQSTTVICVTLIGHSFCRF
jgi:hypothetical protein